MFLLLIMLELVKWILAMSWLQPSVTNIDVMVQCKPRKWYIDSSYTIVECLPFAMLN